MKGSIRYQIINLKEHEKVPLLEYSACVPSCVIPIILSEFTLLPFLNSKDSHTSHGRISN